jgi:hypothetical protein
VLLHNLAHQLAHHTLFYPISGGKKKEEEKLMAHQNF